MRCCDVTKVKSYLVINENRLFYVHLGIKNCFFEFKSSGIDRTKKCPIGKSFVLILSITFTFNIFV